MTPDKLNAITQLLMALAAVIGPVSAAYIARLRFRLKMARIAQGEKVEDESLLGRVGPVVLLLLGGALLGYLLVQHPELARLPIVLDSEELAAAGPVYRSCKSASDCAKGCACTGGECTPCSARKPNQAPPQRQHPRLVADINLHPLCADCMVLPQMTTALAAPFSR